MFEHLVDRATTKKPLRLADLLFEYDRLEKIHLTRDELHDIVETLFKNGQVIELKHGQYITNPHPHNKGSFTPVSEELYELASAEKHGWFKSQ